MPVFFSSLPFLHVTYVESDNSQVLHSRSAAMRIQWTVSCSDSNCVENLRWEVCFRLVASTRCTSTSPSRPNRTSINANVTNRPKTTSTGISTNTTSSSNSTTSSLYQFSKYKYSLAFVGKGRHRWHVSQSRSGWSYEFQRFERNTEVIGQVRRQMRRLFLYLNLRNCANRRRDLLSDKNKRNCLDLSKPHHGQ